MKNNLRKRLITNFRKFDHHSEFRGFSTP